MNSGSEENNRKLHSGQAVSRKGFELIVPSYTSRGLPTESNYFAQLPITK